MTVRIGVSYVRNDPSGQAYLNAIRSAGAQPVTLATPDNCPRWPTSDQARAIFDPGFPPIEQLNDVDGLLLTGGTDISPMLYHEAMAGSEMSDWSRDFVETAQFRRARARRIPILGICRGMQFLNVVSGGALVQHLPTADIHRDPTGQHQSQPHQVRIIVGTYLSEILAGAATTDADQTFTVGVNSYHHQGVAPQSLMPNFVATGFSIVPEHPEQPDILEAFESERTQNHDDYLVAVQWHPERIEDVVPPALGQKLSFREMSERIFEDFVAVAEARKPGAERVFVSFSPMR